jgi:hypothetical protein
MVVRPAGAMVECGALQFWAGKWAGTSKLDISPHTDPTAIVYTREIYHNTALCSLDIYIQSFSTVRIPYKYYEYRYVSKNDTFFKSLAHVDQ